jgi:hypothetical protein
MHLGICKANNKRRLLTFKIERCKALITRRNIMDHAIFNCFASVLVFYEQFKRTKLNPADLTKIAKKYESKPNQLIADLVKKYDIQITEKCELRNVQRICHIFAVPDSYLNLLPKQIREQKYFSYDPVFDIRSVHFDPEKVLTSKRIISPTSTSEALDNLSRCNSLFTSGQEKKQTTHKVHVKVRDREIKVRQEKPLHILERIALDSCSKCKLDIEIGGEPLPKSPFSLAYAFMKGKGRVRVVIRKRAG